jgi:hypothetical protein
VNIDLKQQDRLPVSIVNWPMPIDRVLYEAEQPIVFLTHSTAGQPLLVYLAHEAADVSYFVLASASTAKIHMLEQGKIGVREAICSDWMWLARYGRMQDHAELWSVIEADIPNDYLPVPGTPLFPEHTVVFAARALGDGIELGRMPCSVLSLVADSARASLKAVLDYVRSANTEGRPTDAQRALYDLPVQRLRFASFEVGLAEPHSDLFRDESLQRAVNYLERGLSWAETTSDVTVSPGDSPEEREAVLRATLALTPPSSGVVSAIEVSGAWLKGRRFYLDRNSRTKVSRQLRNLRSERIVLYSGRIGEIDDDNLSFTLRETDDSVDRKGSFPEDLLDDMRTHYYESNRVQISGVELSGRLRVTAVVALDAPSEA